MYEYIISKNILFVNSNFTVCYNRPMSKLEQDFTDFVLKNLKDFDRRRLNYYINQSQHKHNLIKAKRKKQRQNRRKGI